MLPRYSSRSGPRRGDGARTTGATGSGAITARTSTRPMRTWIGAGVAGARRSSSGRSRGRGGVAGVSGVGVDRGAGGGAGDGSVAGSAARAAAGAAAAGAGVGCRRGASADDRFVVGRRPDSSSVTRTTGRRAAAGVRTAGSSSGCCSRRGWRASSARCFPPRAEWTTRPSAARTPARLLGDGGRSRGVAVEVRRRRRRRRRLEHECRWCSVARFVLVVLERDRLHRLEACRHVGVPLVRLAGHSFGQGAQEPGHRPRLRFCVSVGFP